MPRPPRRASPPSLALPPCHSYLLAAAAAAAGLLQLRAIIDKYPNKKPCGIGVRIGNADSLERRSQGSSGSATHLRTATRDRGSLTDGGLLFVNSVGRDAMAKVIAADPVDVEIAAAIIVGSGNHRRQLPFDEAPSAQAVPPQAHATGER